MSLFPTPEEAEMDLRDYEALPDYEVECARCGLRLMASEAVPEEGDEWECEPCWERCEAAERASADRGTVP